MSRQRTSRRSWVALWRCCLRTWIALVGRLYRRSRLNLTHFVRLRPLFARAALRTPLMHFGITLGLSRRRRYTMAPGKECLRMEPEGVHSPLGGCCRCDAMGGKLLHERGTQERPCVREHRSGDRGSDLQLQNNVYKRWLHRRVYMAAARR